jgi:hypothetical protein
MSGCDVNIFKGYERDAIDDTERLFLLQMVEKEDYEDIKKGGNLDVDIVVDGLPIKGTADYDEFVTRRNEEFRYLKFDNVKKYSRDYLVHHLGKEGLAAYIACLHTTTPLVAHVEPGTTTEDVISIRISWRPTSFSGQRKLSISYIGLAPGEKTDVVKQLPDKDSASFVVTVKRDPSKNFRATLSIDQTSYGQVVEVPRKLSRKKEKVVRDFVKKGRIEHTAIDRKEEYVRLEVPQPWHILEDTVNISPPGQGGQGAPRPWGAARGGVTDREAGYRIWMNRNANDPTVVEWRIYAKAEAMLDVFE